MAVTMQTSHTLIDDGDLARADVVLSQRIDDEGDPVITIQQDDNDTIWMSPEHARAVANAILSLTSSTAKE